jgi:uncharacterized phage protein (TIGR02220 family)
MTNRELYIKAVELVGKEVMEVKQRQFLQRIIKKNQAPKSPKGDFDKRGMKNEIYQEIITYLNNQSGKQFRWNTPETKALIRARLNEGFTVKEFKQVIDIKCKQWLTNEYFKFLRPKTLFGTKFEGYLQEWIVFKKKEEYQRKEFEKARRIERGEADPELSPGERKAQIAWEKKKKRLISEATPEDWQDYYHQEKLFKKKAYTHGLKDPFIRNLFAYYLDKKEKEKEAHTKTRRHEEELRIEN